MFKCSECGTKYKVKPDYCRCGNDLFEEVVVSSNSNPNSNNNLIPKEDLLHYSIFFACILLSLIILFAGSGKNKPKETLNSMPANSANSAAKSIPEIDEFWDNSVTLPQQTTKIEQPVSLIPPVAKLTQKPLTPPAVTKAKAPSSSSVKKTATGVKTSSGEKVASQVKTVSGAKATTTSKTVPSKTKTAQSTDFSALTSRIKNNINYNQNPNRQTGHNQNQPVQKTSASTKSTLAPVGASNVHKNNSAINQALSANTVSKSPSINPRPQKSQAQLKQELNSYKNALRNTLARKIDFTRVIGDGECTLSFKIDPYGKLLNKKFIKQSSNLTLNEQAFKALNSTSAYNPPPEGYHNETLVLNIHFYNGNFEISLK